MQAGRNIGMSFRRNVGIDAHRDRRSFLQSRRGRGEQSQFRSAFNVEQKYSRAQREFHLGGGFADAGKHNFARSFPVCAQNPLQFSAGNDVEARAFAGYQSQNRERRIGFDGIAQSVWELTERRARRLASARGSSRRNRRRAEFRGARPGLPARRLAVQARAARALLKSGSRYPKAGGRNACDASRWLHLRLPGPALTLMATTV